MDYKQHIVRTEEHVVNFKEVNDMRRVPYGGIQVNGCNETVTGFVKSLNLDSEWIPYGYSLRFIFRNVDSDNMTAFIYKTAV